MKNRRGFTLIELLVVVAIIALLIAILLPSLGRAKAQAVRVKCAAVLKQWGNVMNTYSMEYENYITNKTSGQQWNSTGSGYNTQWAARFNATMRMCPGLLPPGNNTTSYSMPRYFPIVANVQQWKITSFRTPAETVLLLDTATNGAGVVTSMSDTALKAPELPDAMKERHRGVGMVLFLDTHVDAKKQQDYIDNIPSTITSNNAPVNERYKQWFKVGN